MEFGHFKVAFFGELFYLFFIEAIITACKAAACRKRSGDGNDPYFETLFSACPFKHYCHTCHVKSCNTFHMIISLYSFCSDLSSVSSMHPDERIFTRDRLSSKMISLQFPGKISNPFG